MPFGGQGVQALAYEFCFYYPSGQGWRSQQSTSATSPQNIVRQCHTSVFGGLGVVVGLSTVSGLLSATFVQAASRLSRQNLRQILHHRLIELQLLAWDQAMRGDFSRLAVRQSLLTSSHAELDKKICLVPADRPRRSHETRAPDVFFSLAMGDISL